MNTLYEESPSFRPSYNDTLLDVKAQVEFDIFPQEKMYEAENLCRIIADVMLLPGSDCLRIGGRMYQAKYVQEIFSRLKYENLSYVIDSLGKVNYRIKNLKNYLITSLFNSFFESDIRESFPEVN